MHLKKSILFAEIVIGDMDLTPDPKRRFWGGGTYIMGKLPINGTAVRIDYTALLNTQGRRDIITFKFIAGLMRELPDQYQLINATEVEIISGVPTHISGYNGTIHSDTKAIPNWQVQEGDQFAVFVYNDCINNFCPANVNLLNKNGCESTLYQPFVFPQSQSPHLYNISKSDPLVRNASVTVNMDIVIGNQNFWYLYNIKMHACSSISFRHKLHTRFSFLVLL